MYMRYVLRTKVIQFAAFGLLFFVIGFVSLFLTGAAQVLTGFITAAKESLPGYLPGHGILLLLGQLVILLAALGLCFLAAIFVTESLRVIHWTKRSLQAHWQHLTPPHEADNDGDRRLFSQAVWTEQNQKPLTGIKMQSGRPALGQALRAIGLAVVVGFFGNVLATILIAGGLRGTSSLPLWVIKDISSIVLPLLGPVATVLQRVGVFVSENTTSVWAFAGVVLLLVSSVFLVVAILNLLWATEEWLFGVCKRTRQGDNALSSLIGTGKRASSQVVDSVTPICITSLRPRPWLAFLLALGSALTYTSSAVLWAVYTDFNEAPLSAVIGALISLAIIIAWVQGRTDPFNRASQTPSTLLLLTGFFVFSVLMLQNALHVI